jgi:dTDP-glucose 4,6-dehydratase
MTMAYHRFHGVDTRIVRIFNTYGPRMDLEDGRALPNLLKQALLGQPLTVYGEGKQTRSFCYVDDLVDGIVRLLYSNEHLPVNIGNPRGDDHPRICRSHQPHHGQQGGHHLSWKTHAARATRSAASPTSPAQSEILRWEPNVNLEEGIRRTIPYFKQKLGLA